MKKLLLQDLKTINEDIKQELLFEKRIFITGPIGSGKTTLAKAIINKLDAISYEIDGASANAEELEQVFTSLKHNNLFRRSRVLFIDEIQRMNRLLVSRCLVPFQNLDCTIICCSSRNYAELRKGRGEEFSALMSRLHYVIDLDQNLDTIVQILIDSGIPPEDAASRAKSCGGDLRSALYGNVFVNEEFKDFSDIIKDPDDVISDLCRKNYKHNYKFVQELLALSCINNPSHKAWGIISVCYFHKVKIPKCG